MKQLILRLLTRIICWLPEKQAIALLDALCAIRPSLVLPLILRLPRHAIVTKAWKYAGFYAILTDDQLDKFEYRVIDPERIETVPFPYVTGLSTGGNYAILKPKTAIYRFTDVVFHPLSDALRVGDKVYWEKSSRIQFAKAIPMDRDLLAYDKEHRSLFLRNYPRTQKIKNGFSVTGVNINSWGHFIGNFFPKLIALKSINDMELVVLLPTNVDEHIRSLVETCVARLGPYKVLYLDPDVPVVCESLYYCGSPSYLADHANYLHPADIHISQYSIRALHELVGLTRIENRSLGTRKIFIGRTGPRNLINYPEVEAFFIELGFEVIYPHLLTLREKISAFEEATHIAGPLSSGFANSIFSRPGTKIFAFINFARSLDLYFAPFTLDPFFMKTFFVSGDESCTSDIHNSYRVSLDKIRAGLAETEFLS